MGTTNVERAFIKRGVGILEPRNVQLQAMQLHAARTHEITEVEQAEILSTQYNYRISDCGTDCDGSFTKIVREGLDGQKNITYVNGLNVCGKTPLEAKELVTKVCTEQPHRFHWDIHTPDIITYGMEVSSEASVTRIYRLWNDNLVDVAEVNGIILFRDDMKTLIL